MTAKEKIEVHAEIEMENRDHIQRWLYNMYWDSLTVNEIEEMIQKKELAMELDGEYGFLCDLYAKKVGTVK